MKQGIQAEDRGEAIAYVEYSNDEKIFELIVSKTKGNHIILTSLNDINARFGSNFNNRKLGFDITPEQLYEATPTKIVSLRNLLLSVIKNMNELDHEDREEPVRQVKNEPVFITKTIVEEKKVNNTKKIRLLDMTMRDLGIVKYLLLLLVVLTITLIVLSIPQSHSSNRIRKQPEPRGTNDIFYM